MCLAGAYAEHIITTLEHPKLEQMPLSYVREAAQREPPSTDVLRVLEAVQDEADLANLFAVVGSMIEMS